MESTLTSQRVSRIYDRGDLLPQVTSGIWQVCQGWVQLNTYMAMGEERVLGWVGPSMWLGEGLTTRHNHHMKALSRVLMTWYPLDEIQHSPKHGYSLLQQKAKRLYQLEHLLSITAQKRASDRLDNLLRLLTREMGQPTAEGIRLKARLTHQDLANAIGVNRVTVTRILGEFKRQNRLFLDASKHWLVMPEKSQHLNVAQRGSNFH
ncbi:MAG: Crp/Fnr family transcriptional regulator [Phormidium sp. BM_Day4_Bin.17]|nr:Crp/Fnr family transcriptional regulator [Phormidium sp. BM_Day4_Bin.17]UCJ13595.1 MAG: Crp/Fnr family transcriptional regulator [Phormidium sp. PBR-2020]